MRKLKISTAVFVMLAAMTVCMTGCSAQKQTEQKVTELENKMAESDRKLSALESDLKKAAFEINQLKNVVSRIGDVVVNLQRAGEGRHTKSNGASSHKAAPKPKKLPTKKKHAR